MPGFNLQALTNIAFIGDKVGMNMWEFKSENNKSLSLAFNYLAQVVNGVKWNHNTLKTVDLTTLPPIISQFPSKFNSEKYSSLLKKALEIIEKNGQNDKLQEFWLLNIN